MPEAKIATAYSAQLSASGGAGGYVFTGVTTPAGLMVMNDGAVVGTPTVCSTLGQTFAVTVDVVDSAAASTTATVSLYINCANFSIAPGVVPSGTAGKPYSQVFSLVGPAFPFNFNLTGTLPPGMTFMGAELSGIPATPGTYPFTLRVVNLVTGAAVLRQYVLVIKDPVITVVPDKLADGTVAVPYTPESFVASGGTAPYSFVLTKGGGTGLPKGMSMDTTGEVSGTPVKTGTYQFLVTATDSNGKKGSVFATLVVDGDIVLHPPKLPDGALGIPYKETITATGGVGPYVFKRLDGSLPDGLKLRANGRLSGVPTRAGVFDFVVGATDSGGLKGQRAYTIRVGVADPRDPDLMGIIIEEHRAARRSARTQIGSVAARLQSLRSGDCDLFSNRIQVIDGNGETAAAAATAGSGGTDGQAAAGGEEEPRFDTRCDDDRHRVRAWTSGTLQIGTTEADRLSPMVDILSSGLTAGIDYRFNAGAIGGVAVGIGRERANIGSDNTRLDTRSLSAALYLGLTPSENTFVDGIAGVGLFDFDRHRYVSAVDGFSDGTRSATQVFSSLGGGFRNVSPTGWQTEVSGRLDSSVTWFDRSRDYGAGKFDATYEPATDFGLDGVLTIMARRPLDTRFGILTPRAGLEYRYAFVNDFDQRYGFVGGRAGQYEISGEAGPRQAITLDFGTDLTINDGFQLGADYRASIGTGIVTHTFGARAALRF